jgi:hypothetical protein
VDDFFNQYASGWNHSANSRAGFRFMHRPNQTAALAELAPIAAAKKPLLTIPSTGCF